MISVLIPWRSSEPERVRAWEFLRPLWEQLDVQLCVADDGLTGPFSVARAINRARRMASGDMLVLYGADHIPPDKARLDWIADRLQAHPWTAVYGSVRIFNPHGTDLIIHGWDPADCFGWTHTTIAMCTGILAMRTSVFDDVGGMDERFRGWGAEDSALRFVLRHLHPDGNDTGEGELWSLFHHEAPRDYLTNRNASMVHNGYEIAAREGWLRRYVEEVHGDRARD